MNPRAKHLTINNVHPSNPSIDPINPAFSMTYEYYNYTRFSLYIKTQDNLLIKIDPIRGEPHTPHYKNHFIVKVITKKPCSGVEYNTEELSRNTNCPTAQATLMAINSNANVQGAYQTTHTVDYCIPLEDLCNQTVSVFIENLNILLTAISQISLIPKHPYSKSYEHENHFALNPMMSGGGNFNYYLSVNDPYNTIGDLYVNINNQVYKLPKTRDVTKESKIILQTSSANDTGESIVDSKEYRLEEGMKELNLFTSHHDATHRGNLEHAIKQQEFNNKTTQFEHQSHIADLQFKQTVEGLNNKKEELDLKREQLKQEMEYKRKQYKQELKQRKKKYREELKRKEEELRLKQEERTQELNELKEKARLDREQLEARLQHQYEQMQNKLKEERYQRDLERKAMKNKEKYEKKAQQRKETLEVLKFLPMVATAILTLFVVYGRSNSVKI